MDKKRRAVAQEFLEKLDQEGIARATKIRNDRCLKQLDAELGHRPVSDIEPFEVLAALKKFERRGIHETAKRLRAFAARVFRYAIVTGRARHNAAADLGEALVSLKIKHLAAIVDPQVLGELLRFIETFDKYMVLSAFWIGAASSYKKSKQRQCFCGKLYRLSSVPAGAQLYIEVPPAGEVRRD